MRYRSITISLILVFLLTGCVRSQQLEDLSVIITRGIDYEDEEIKITMVSLQFEVDSPISTKIITGKSASVKGAVDDASKKANQEVVGGKLELEIYGREVAERGLKPYLDTLRRDATIPDTMLIAISDTAAEDVINVPQSKGISTNIGEFLHGLLESTVRERIFPSISLQQFRSTINAEGVDPFLPVLGLEEGIPTMKAIALFKDDKLLGTSSIEDANLFKMSQGAVRGHLEEFNVPREAISEYIISNENEDANSPEEVHISTRIEKGSAKTDLIDKKNLTFQTEVNMDINLLEISVDYKFDDEKAIKKLEKEIQKLTKERYEKLLAHFKELNTDSFGYGNVYRMNKKGGKLSDKEWDEKFPTIDVDFKVNVDIIRHGTINK
ncbi:Ger(x)C family spore germination protein [Ornithinibacillus contaminans]|uniref:Ger(x)C family spore germination protein n=1 Tax=Ornithinibacillus contaminans TaxID=694055 RepID=UPI00064DF8C2|nr:Ger(x)C family spore germination protein [Ornithinibacillus contaminans]